MKLNVHLRLILPLSLLTFGWINRWCYVLVEDGPDVFLYGFPLPYQCSGFHTSLSTQYFILEMLTDLVVYYGLLALVIWFITEYWKSLTLPRIFGRILWAIVALYLSGWAYLSHQLDDRYHLYRDFRIEVIDCGLRPFTLPSRSN